MKAPVVTVSWLIAAMILFTACGGKEEPKENAPPPSEAQEPTAPASATQPAPNEYTQQIKIKTPDDVRVVEIKNGTQTKIEIGPEGSTQILRGEMRSNGKRKYEMEGGKVIAEVKADEDAFKLRSIDGKLLWKVKLDPDKIKISDNEENQNPYELKMRDDDVKVEENQTELGKVNFYSDRAKVKVKDAGGAELFESNTDQRSVAYGVLLMSRIPDTERYIIMAELLARGR
jgi:hypothetical protein